MSFKNFVAMKILQIPFIRAVMLGRMAGAYHAGSFSYKHYQEKGCYPIIHATMRELQEEFYKLSDEKDWKPCWTAFEKF